MNMFNNHFSASLFMWRGRIVETVICVDVKLEQLNVRCAENSSIWRGAFLRARGTIAIPPGINLSLKSGHSMLIFRNENCCFSVTKSVHNSNWKCSSGSGSGSSRDYVQHGVCNAWQFSNIVWHDGFACVTFNGLQAIFWYSDELLDCTVLSSNEVDTLRYST